jgi:hypothetical protein
MPKFPGIGETWASWMMATGGDEDVKAPSFRIWGETWRLGCQGQGCQVGHVSSRFAALACGLCLPGYRPAGDRADIKGSLRFSPSARPDRPLPGGGWRGACCAASRRSQLRGPSLALRMTGALARGGETRSAGPPLRGLGEDHPVPPDLVSGAGVWRPYAESAGKKVRRYWVIRWGKPGAWRPGRLEGTRGRTAR